MFRLMSGALALACAITVCPSAIAAEQKAHEHGKGTLTIAADGGTVSIELQAPGNDIAGFERAPATDADKAAVAAAEKTLSNLEAVLGLDPAAGCAVKSSKAVFRAGEGSGEHAEFQVTYLLQCTAPEKLAAINFPYFKSFSQAEELDVTVVTHRGQGAFEVTPSTASIDLTSISLNQ